MVTGQGILDALGVPPASLADSGWADVCAVAATAFCDALPGAVDRSPAFDMGELMLAVSLYNRRGTGIPADPDLAIPQALDPTISRLLRLGFYQKPVVG